VAIQRAHLFVHNPQEELLEERLDLRLQRGVVLLGFFQQVFLDAESLFFLDLLSSELSPIKVNVGRIIGRHLPEWTVLVIVTYSHGGLVPEEAAAVVDLCHVTQFITEVKVLFVNLCQN
jgi:hypothetical protein